MLELIHESGVGAWFSLLITIGGLAAVLTVGRRIGRPGSVAAAFAVAVLASGAIGVGTGQRKVDRAVMDSQDLAQRVEIVSIGTREASANLLFSGMCAQLVMIVGGALALAAARKRPAAS